MRELLDRLGEPDGTGDPGRVHEEGRVARESVELAREQVAALACVAPRRVVFTSGATEAANTAVASFGPGSAIFCAPVEHSCVREASARTGRLVEVGVLPDGAIDLESLGSLLGRSAGRAPVLVNCQWANHEVATVQPVEAVAELCSKAGADLHVDAAAAFGHVPTDFGSLDAEYASVSAHKMGGPAGVGALILGRGVRLQPLLVGGTCPSRRCREPPRDRRLRGSRGRAAGGGPASGGVCCRSWMAFRPRRDRLRSRGYFFAGTCRH